MLCKRVVLVLFQHERALLKPQNNNAYLTKPFSSKTHTADEQSFTVSYLISSCGLSPETALRASKRVHFRSAERPDSVLTLLRNHGFNDSHISKIARVRPKVLSSDPRKTLLPKLEFFQSIGIRSADLGEILSSSPDLLQSSIDNMLRPVFNFLKNVIHLDDKQIRKALKYSSRILLKDLENSIIPRITVLKELGVSTSNLAHLVIYPTVLVQKSNRFDEIVKKVVEMGVNPSKLIFSSVLHMLVRMSESTWEHKMEVYRKCGWSEYVLKEAIRREPRCMRLSEKKIISVMDFLVNKMGWKPTDIARVPKVLNYSLERRIIPRCSVIKILIWKGLIKKDLCCSTVLIKNDKAFFDYFVTKYKEDVPQLVDVFNGKVGLAELGFEPREICGWELL